MRAISMKLAGQHAKAAGIIASLQKNSPCPVTKQHTGRPVIPVKDLGKAFSANDQRTPSPTSAEHRISHIKGIDEPRANRLHIKGNGLRRAELVLHLGCG